MASPSTTAATFTTDGSKAAQRPPTAQHPTAAPGRVTQRCGPYVPAAGPVSHASRAAEEAAALASGVDLARLRKRTELPFDTQRHPLREAALACLCLEPTGSSSADGALRGQLQLQ